MDDNVMSTVIITGASKGIGKATAKRFLEKGSTVINVSRTDSDLPGINNATMDLAAPDAASNVAALANSLSEGELHLIHNAARLTNDSVRDVDANQFRAIVDINMIGPQILNHHLLPKMTSGSSIIYVGSTLSEKAVANSFTYVSTKHALIGMMRATCQDLGGSGIHTACICPGFTDTEMLREHVGDAEDVLSAIAGMSSFNRLVEPDEIAQSICFAVATPAINGTVMHVNLGQIES